MLALKRLTDAERDGDRIYAILRGIGASSDGRFKSIYAPRQEGQIVALHRAYEAAGFGPDILTLQTHPAEESASGGSGALLLDRPKVRFSAETTGEFYRRKNHD